MVDSPAISAVHRPILRDPQSMPECDYPSANQRMAIWSMNQIQRMDRFLHVIRKTCIEQRGKLIIPASVSAERRKSFAARPGEYR
jgi:metallo-beta-lactamase family protein